MSKSKTIAEIVKKTESELGKPITQRKIDFAVSSTLTNPDNNAQAARDAGYEGEHANQAGHELANDSEVQLIISKIEAEIGDINDIDIENLVKQTLLKEMLTAEASRDRINAAEKLGKTKGMFRDVIEQPDTRTNAQMLDDIEEKFGEVARKRAEKMLGIKPKLIH